jgi:hypothetical protein
MTPTTAWPNGKSFAFTIFDDTDLAALPEIKYVYDFLKDLGFKTTKSVWPLEGSGHPAIGGTTCADEAYLAWVRQLQADGFEVGFHSPTYETSTRQQTLLGLDRFRDLFGHDPGAYANHAHCAEGMYWGSARLGGWRRALYNLATRNRNDGTFQGHLEASPLFWGDLCRERIKYMRNFVTGNINTLEACPFMPYFDPDRPYVNGWFASSDGPDAAAFCRVISEDAQERLEQDGGACIMYTHLACGFFEGGRLNPRWKALMERLIRKPGHFVPVTPMLDFLGGGDTHSITRRERAALERRWLLYKIRMGGTA